MLAFRSRARTFIFPNPWPCPFRFAIAVTCSEVLKITPFGRGSEYENLESFEWL